MAIDVLVITALKEELDGLLTAVPGGRAVWHDHQDSQHFPYHTVELARPKGRPLRLAAAWAGAMGRMIAASRASQLIGELDARCLAICGVCAGRRHDTFLGDVIVADRVWSYDSGKATDADFYHEITTYNLEAHWSVQARYLADESAKIDGLAEVVRRRPHSIERYATWLLHHQLLHETENMPSPQTLAERPQGNDWNATVARLEAQELVVVERGKLQLTEAGLDQAADHRFRHPDGLPPEPAFRIHVAPIATGEAVQKDPGLFARLERVDRKTLGVEMEASAIGYVAWARRIPSIVIKSVMDHGDQIKDDRFRDFACEVSARVLLGFLRIHVAIDPARATEVAAGREAYGVTECEDTSAPARADQVLAYPDVPFDIGTLWGLDRGPWLGVWLGPVDVVARAMQEAERLVAREFGWDLPRRRWQRLVLAEHRDVPRSSAELIEMTRGGSAITGGDALGLIVEVSPDLSLRTAGDLVRAIAGLPDAPDPAIVLVWPRSASARPVAVEQVEALAGVLPGAWIDVRGAVRRPVRLAASVVDPVTLLGGPPTASAARDWVADLVIAVVRREFRDRADAERMNARWQQLAGLARERVSTVSSAHAPVDPAAAVDALLRAGEFDLLREFLDFVREYEPHALRGLVRRIAESTEHHGLVDGVALTCDEAMDGWADALLGGDEGRAAALPRDWAQRLRDVRLGDVVDMAERLSTLVLGLLRWTNRGGGERRSILRSLVAELPSSLGPTMRTLVDLSLAPVRMTDAVRDGDPEAAMLGLRAGIEVPVPALSLDFRDERPWWPVTAAPPSQRLLAALRPLPAGARGILGLWTTHERAGFDNNPTWQDYARECRRGVWRRPA